MKRERKREWCNVRLTIVAIFILLIGFCTNNGICASNESVITFDFIIAAKNYALSKIIDGKGEIETTQEVTDLKNNSVSKASVSVSFIGNTMKIVRFETSWPQADGKEMLMQYYADEQGFTVYDVSRKWAVKEPIDNLGFKWFPLLDRWVDPLYYADFYRNTNRDDFFHALKTRGTIKKVADSPDSIIVEVSSSEVEENKTKAISYMDTTKDFFQTKLEIYVLPKNQTEWFLVSSLEAIPIFTDAGWLPAEVNYVFNKFNLDDGEKPVLTKIQKERTVYKNFKFNIGLKKENLALKLPAGVFVNDTIAGITYLTEGN